MKIYLALGAAILGLSGLLYWSIQSTGELQAENKALTEAAEQAQRRAKADRKVLVARQAEIASQARKTAQAQQALSEALQRNKSWSDTDVPTDVQKALQGRSDGPDSGSAGL